MAPAQVAAAMSSSGPVGSEYTQRGHACVVDQHLDVADPIDQRRHSNGIGKIRGESDGIDALRSELEGAILNPGRHRRDGDAVTRLPQSPGDGKSDSGWASGPRDESDRLLSEVHMRLFEIVPRSG